MAGHAIALVEADVRTRFAAAAACEPLSALGATARDELAALLAAPCAFEELPGKWQAALVAAETRAAGSRPPAGGCCHGG